MKSKTFKSLLILVLIHFTVPALSQETTNDTTKYWKLGGVGNLNFSQVSFENWAAGGENSYSLNSFLSLHANYSKDKISWENSLDMGYGLIKQGEREVRKTDDKLELSSQFGYKTSSNWFYTGAFSFKTQFDKGYKYNDAENTKRMISNFMAPAYSLLSLGMDYKPSEHFDILISPITGKTTFVLDDTLSEAGAFGVEPGKNVRSEFGSFLKIKYNKDILENVNLNTKLELFSNYLDEPGNVDINWEMLIAMKINEYLSANINTQLLYDDNIKYVNKQGNQQGPRIQFKEVFGVGLSYKF